MTKLIPALFLLATMSAVAMTDEERKQVADQEAMWERIPVTSATFRQPANGWQRVDVIAGHFAVSFPCSPEIRANATGVMYLCPSDSRVYAVDFYRAAGSPSTSLPFIFEGTVAGAAKSSLFGGEPTVQREARISYDGLSGRQLKLSSAKAEQEMRSVMTPFGLVTMSVIARPARGIGDAAAFFDSLQGLGSSP